MIEVDKLLRKYFIYAILKIDFLYEKMQKINFLLIEEDLVIF